MSKNFIILGDAGVGKTAFINRISTGEFIKKYNPTNVSINDLQLEEFSSKSIEFGGQFFPYNFKKNLDIDFAFIMFDKSSKTSFKNIMKYYNFITTYYSSIPIFLLGNKADIIESKVHMIDVRNLTGSIQIPYYDISAKTNYQIHKPFQFINNLLQFHNNFKPQLDFIMKHCSYSN